MYLKISAIFGNFVPKTKSPKYVMNLTVVDFQDQTFIFQLNVNGLCGQVAVQHVDQGWHQGLFWFLQKMEARIVQAQKVNTAI